MVLSMYVDVGDDKGATDERILDAAVEQSLLAGKLGFNPWYTEHHFRGPWHSSPLQFAAYIAPQLPPGRRLGFGVLSVPYYHPVRLAEQMRSTPVTSRAARDYMRVFLSGASDEVPDKQGRITIPPVLREYAGLDRECTVIGAGSRVEIWDAAAWSSYLEATEQAFSDQAEEVIPGLL